MTGQVTVRVRSPLMRRQGGDGGITVLGIDLASSSWGAVGSALLQVNVDARTGGGVGAGAFTRVVPGIAVWPDAPLTHVALAEAIHALAVATFADAVALDGPHAWRNPLTPADAPGVGRRCEYLCRTQGKTGVYPRAYPGTQFAWMDFCVRVFDALLAREGVRLADGGAPVSGATAAGAAASRPLTTGESRHAGYVVLECFPTSIWRSSGLSPLPGKTRRPALAPHYARLAAAYALPPADVSSHDDLQAIVAALAGVGAVGGPVQALPRGEACRIATHADGPRRVEGFIWDAAPQRNTALQSR